MGTEYELLKVEYEQLLEEKDQLENKVSKLKEEVEDLEEENKYLYDQSSEYEESAENWHKVEDMFEGIDLNNLDTVMKIESFMQHCKDMPSWKFDQMVQNYKTSSK